MTQLHYTYIYILSVSLCVCMHMLQQSLTVAHERRDLPSAPILGVISMAFRAEISLEGFGPVLALGP